MKRIGPTYSHINIYCFLFINIFCSSLQGYVLAQRTQTLLLPCHLDKKERSYLNFVEIKDDTTVIHDIITWADRFMVQQHYLNLDSIRKYYHRAVSMSLRHNFLRGQSQAYQNLGWSYLYKDIGDSSKYYFRKAIQVDEKHCDTLKLIWHYTCFGWAYIDNYEYDSASLVFKKSMELSVAIKDTAGIIQALSQLGRSNRLSGNFIGSAKNILEYIRITKLQKDTGGLIDAYGGLRELYDVTGAVEKKIEVSKIIFELIQPFRYRNPWGFRYNASLHYLATSEHDSALYYSRLILPKTKNFRSVPTIWSTMGNIFFNINELDSACFYYRAFYTEALKTHMHIDPNTFINLGNCELKKGDNNKALEYYKLAESALWKGKYHFTKVRTLKALHEYFDSINNAELSLEYLKKLKIAEDSIQNQRDAFNDGLVAMLMEAEELEGQVQLLTQNNELQKNLNAKQIEQRNTLFIGAGLLILISVFAFSRYRKNKTLKSKQALLNERLRISRDLHDEVGATLSGIAMYSHIAKEQVKHAESEQVENSLSIMQKSAGEMVNKLSDIVWLMNPEQDTVLSLINRLQEYTEQMASAKNMHVKIYVDEAITEMPFPLEARRNIYLFCKEAINNAVKYSDGSLVELHVSESGGEIQFAIVDDGKGFDEISVRRGNGLKNLKIRAKEIGADFLLKSNPGNGTRIELQYALHSL